MSNVKSHSYLDTFWNRTRVEAGITCTDVAQYLHMSESGVSNYFTGKILPSDYIIHKLCEFFNVDYSTGHSEFYRAHQEYKKMKGSKSFKYINTCTIAEEKAVKDAPKQDELVESEHTDVENNKAPMTSETILPSLYGLLTYQEFAHFTQAMITHDLSVLKSVYGKVTFEDYNLIAEVLKGDGEDEV